MERFTPYEQNSSNCPTNENRPTDHVSALLGRESFMNNNTELHYGTHRIFLDCFFLPWPTVGTTSQDISASAAPVLIILICHQLFWKCRSNLLSSPLRCLHHNQKLHSNFTLVTKKKTNHLPFNSIYWSWRECPQSANPSGRSILERKRWMKKKRMGN